MEHITKHWVKSKQLRVTLDEPSNATDQYIILCTFDNAKNGGKCPINKAKGLENLLTW